MNTMPRLAALMIATGLLLPLGDASAGDKWGFSLSPHGGSFYYKGGSGTFGFSTGVYGSGFSYDSRDLRHRHGGYGYPSGYGYGGHGYGYGSRHGYYGTPYPAYGAYRPGYYQPAPVFVQPAPVVIEQQPVVVIPQAAPQYRDSGCGERQQPTYSVGSPHRGAPIR